MLIKQYILDLPSKAKFAFLQSYENSEVFFDQLKSVILASDPKYLPQLLQKMKQSQHSFLDKLDIMSMLLVEADLMASIIPDYGERLGQSLAQEWATHYPDMSRNVASLEGRKGFLNYVQFKSENAKKLGINQIHHDSREKLLQVNPSI